MRLGQKRASHFSGSVTYSKDNRQVQFDGLVSESQKREETFRLSPGFQKRKKRSAEYPAGR